MNTSAAIQPRSGPPVKHRTPLSCLRLGVRRLACHLQLIVFVLFVLYLLGASRILFGSWPVDSPGVYFGTLILLFVPLPVFVCEFLAVLKRSVIAALLCILWWLVIAAGLLLTPVVVAEGAQPGAPSILPTVLVFVPLGLGAVLLAILHGIWPSLWRETPHRSSASKVV